jgi:DNA polymerase
MAMDESLRSRVRLWLLGERAVGLDSLRVGPDRPMPRAPAPDAASCPATKAAPCPAVAPAPAPSVMELFVAPEKAPFDGPVLPREERARLLNEMNEQQVGSCTRCRLCQARKHTVFGEGDVDAAIFFIGEGPGETEDRMGRPFVGRAGQKLDEMIAAMGLRRNQVYIGNIVKCRPPGNREPAPDEVQTCTPYLVRQLEVVRPKVIVTLGRPATNYMLQSNMSMGALRGQWQSWRGIKLMPTYHPAYILRNYTVETRKAVWNDLQKVMAELGLRPAEDNG